MDNYHFDQRSPSGDKPVDEQVLLSDAAASNWADKLCLAWSVPIRCWKLGGESACGPLFPEETTPSKILVCDCKPPKKKRARKAKKD